MGSRGPIPRKAATTHGARLLRREPKPPRGLGAAGKAEWKRAAAELGPQGRNVLTEASVGLLEDLARAADDAEAFRAVWRREGVMVQSKGRAFQHPMMLAEREVRLSIHRLRRELGITPASVARVPAGPAPEPESDDLTEFER